MVALASLYREPLWVFYRGGQGVEQLHELSGKRLVTGPEGSGTRAVADLLLRENGMRAEAEAAVSAGGEAAAGLLLEGAVDAAFFVASVQVGLIQRLLRAEGIGLMSFSRAPAYGSRHRYLSSVILHRGVIDFGLDIPDREVTLLGPTAMLVSRADFHPALVQLLLQTATMAHAGAGIFAEPGEFPTARYVDLPLHETARQYFEHGRPFLQRYLPFWLAVLLQRLTIVILPLITLTVPLFKVIPPLYRWRVRSRIYRWYRELSSVEVRLEQGVEREILIAALDAIEDELTKVEVPLSYKDELYNLRLHIDLVRVRAEKGKGETETEGE